MATSLAASGELAGAQAIGAELSARGVRDFRVAAQPRGRGGGERRCGWGSALLQEVIDRRDASNPVFARFVLGIPQVRALPMSEALVDAMKLPGPGPGAPT